MNLGAWPDGVPFDAAAGVDSLELEAIITGPGREWHAVLLAVGARALRSGWGARAAISIAERWASRGRRVILADLSLERPDLHEHLGETNGEGLADVFLFGASLAGVTHRREGRSFDFLPPGAYVPDAEEIFASGEWDALLNGVRSAGGLLLAYAPVEAPGVERLSQRLGETIVLALDPGTLRENAALSSARIQLVLRPASAVPLVDPAATPEDDDDEPGAARRPPPDAEDATAAAAAVASFEKVRIPRESGERETLIADLRQRQREAMLVPAPDADDARDAAYRPPLQPAAYSGPIPSYPPRPPEMDVPPTEPDFAATEQPRPRRRSYRRTVILTLIVIAVLSGIAGAWHLIAGFAEQRRAMEAVEDAPASVATPPAGGLASTALPWSVALEAHPNVSTALERIDALRAEDGRFSFYITPVLVDGVIYYRLMSGPVADSATAAGMMASLVEAGHKTGGSELDIRRTPLSFQLGVAASRAEAERRVQDLQSLAIPAYIVLDEAEHGVVYRVYGGAYAAAGEAQVMRELLRTAGQPDSLVTRTGRSTQ